MTRPSLAGIEKRAAEATPGPWTNGGQGWMFAPALHGSRPGDMSDLLASVNTDDPDATFIADARTVVPALTAVVRDVLALHARVVDEPVLIDEPPRHDHARDCCDADGETWPCATRRAIAARLDLTDPEGDPT